MMKGRRWTRAGHIVSSEYYYLRCLSNSHYVALSGTTLSALQISNLFNIMFAIVLLRNQDWGGQVSEQGAGVGDSSRHKFQSHRLKDQHTAPLKARGPTYGVGLGTVYFEKSSDGGWTEQGRLPSHCAHACWSGT